MSAIGAIQKSYTVVRVKESKNTEFPEGMEGRGREKKGGREWEGEGVGGEAVRGRGEGERKRSEGEGEGGRGRKGNRGWEGKAEKRRRGSGDIKREEGVVI